MKLIKAIIREERLQHVQKALAEKNVYGMTVLAVKGRGSNGGVHLKYRGGILDIGLLPSVAIEIVIPDALEDSAVSQILSAARVGKEGDGKIFMLPVQETHRIRTGEVEV